MYPAAQNHDSTSIFDKSNLLQTLLTGMEWSEAAINEEVESRANYEILTD